MVIKDFVLLAFAIHFRQQKILFYCVLTESWANMVVIKTCSDLQKNLISEKANIIYYFFS